MTFLGFFTRSTPEPLVVIPQPDLTANVQAYESMPAWMLR